MNPLTNYAKQSLELEPRATRLAPPEDLKLSARTLGTRLVFDVPVSNISRTGFLMEWENSKQSLPFIENTLLEIELSAKLKGEVRKINCMGKVVRRIGEANKSTYGVKMIHNDDHDHIEWMSLITSFEKTQPHL